MPARRLTDSPRWEALPAARWHWLQAFRREAQAEFRRQGIPTTRLEEWKYTSLGDLAERRFQADGGRRPAAASAGPPPALPSHHFLLFQSGRWQSESSRLLALPPGAKLMALRQALSTERALIEAHLGRIAPLREHPFAALNSARLDDGLLLYLPAGCRLAAPVYCRFVGPPEGAARACYPRLLVVLADGAEATLIEEYCGGSEQSAHLSAGLSEISLARDARLQHCKRLADGAAAQHIAGIHVAQAAGSQYRAFLLVLAGGLGRNDLQVQLQGRGAEAQLDGLYLLAGQQHLDNHLRVDHLQPGGRSEVLYKGILSDRAHGVFNGKAVVHPDAQQSDARQVNKNLLLSDGAEMDTKPELQIEADDVQCSHGATVGYLDGEALFYLQSRGLDLAGAEGLLTFAFAREVLQRQPDVALRAWLEADVAAALPRLLGTRGKTEATP